MNLQVLHRAAVSGAFTIVRRPHDKRVARRAALSSTALVGVALLAVGATAAHAQDLPVGGTVASGAASVTTSGATTTVTQTSNRAIINWQSFDVAKDKRVVFAQPNANSATLNRVTGTTGSTIAGTISSNGAVYLINPNGIAITASGNVQTGGGFIASSLDMTDADFNAGRFGFTGKGASARVSNAGSIMARQGAYVALLGGSVSNSGTITVPLGRVGLGSGDSIALDLSGDGFLQVAVPTASITGGNTALIEMAGTIAASGGRVELKAATARDAVRNIVNLTDSADSAAMTEGGIVLGNSKGRVNAAAVSPTAQGGSSGKAISVTGNINVDSASGNAGSIVILAGDAGLVKVSGTLSARATGASGDGGLVETSGANVDFTALKIDTSAAHGTTGTWLVDPTDLTVDAAAAATISTNLATTNVTLQTTSTTASGPGTQSPGNGDININSAIGWSSGNTLSLLAYNNINLNAAITGISGGLTLTAGNNVANAGAITASGAVNVGIFNLTNGAWTQNSATLPGFSASDFRFNPVKATFLRVTGGNGSSGTSYQIADVYGLQGMASSTLLTGQNFALANSIDASGTASWNIGEGFIPIGTDGSSVINAGFTGGSFNGNNHTVSGLTILRPSETFVALFGSASSSTLSNVMLNGGTISGANATGALVGSGSTLNISGISSSIAINGDFQVGGLAGNLRDSTISDSFTSGAITAASVAGGLVGYSNGTSVSRSWASGNVTASSNTAGGLIGYTSGTTSVDQTYATGAVTANSDVGGLIGLVSTGTISRSYATGSATATGSYVGGLVGELNGSLSQTYATGAVSGNTAGGLAGALDPSGTISTSVWDSFSTGVSVAAGTGTGTSTATAVTSDPTQSGAANYAFKASAYGAFTASDWVFFDGQTRPFGAWEAVAPGGTILNSHQLQLIGRGDTASLASDYTLGADIDLSETGRVTSGTASSYSGMWSSAGWVPIGTDGAGNIWNGSSFASNGTIGYAGTFDGGGYTISNLTVARSGVNYVGLFGYATTALENVTVGGNVTGADYVGGLAGRTGSGNTLGAAISNAASSVNVWYADYGGGLIGIQNAGSVSGSSASGTVTGTNDGAYSGGLIGYLTNSGTVSNSRASGEIAAGLGNYAGGLIGVSSNGGTISNSSASGKVTGGSTVGGLIGTAQRTSGGAAAITGSSATGAVSGTNYAGGLVGILTGYTVSGSFAAGDVVLTGTTVTRYAGGLVANAGGSSTTYSGAISSSYATGAVTPNNGGTGYYGGLAGATSTYSSVTGSHATGAVSPGTSTGSVYAGGLIGNAGAAVTQSYATGAVAVTSAISTADLGGLVGNLATTGSVDQAWASGAVNYTSINNGTVYAGGLVGNVGGSVPVSRAYATGAVTVGRTAGGVVGGLVGRSQGSITYSYASGAVSGGIFTGGLAGLATNSIGNSNVWDSYSTGRATAVGSGTSSALEVTSDPSLSANSNYAFSAQAYGTMNPHDDWVFFDGQTRPFGAWEIPTSGGTISNSHQLQLIGGAYTNASNVLVSGLTGSYTLANNVSLAETGANLGTAATSAGMWASTGFVPIGTDGANGYWDGTSFKPLANISSGIYGFTGALNGAGYSVTGLFINRPTARNVGLFGLVSGSIQNIAVSGTVTGANGTAGLAGMLYTGGSISGSSSSVNATGANFVGSLVGQQIAGTTVTLSSASGNATGVDDVGGLVGYNSGGTISRSTASGTASGAHYVGGLLGYAGQVTISNSYATGAANASATAAGGLIGKLVSGTVTNTYSTGAVTGAAGLGGLIGQATGGTITGSYWDTQTSGRATSSGGTGRTTAQMKAQATYTGWDFTHTWIIGASGYPVLTNTP